MKYLFFLFFLPLTVTSDGQEPAYGDGEFLKFRIHYGLVTAGYATIEVEEKYLGTTPVHHVKGFGETTGVSRFFFKVEDKYESYINDKDQPLRFIRKIDEGGHTKDIQIDFNHNTQKAQVNNKKWGKTKTVDFPRNAQDMVSAFYYLRNNLDVPSLKEGDETNMNMFFDRENFKFKLKFLGRETLKTKFGNVPCLMFRPYVEAGRVFKEKESLTIWVSDDENKIPILIKAELAVGSLKASLSEFKGLQHSFRTIVD